MSLDILFSEEIFKNKMEKFCSGNDFESWLRFCDVSDWRFLKNDEDICLLGFAINSGSSVVVIVGNGGEIVQFLVQSSQEFKKDEKLPDNVSTLLLKRNSEQLFGFWFIEEVEDVNVYSIKHIAQMRFLDQTLFLDVICNLINESLDFERVVKNISSNTFECENLS